MSLRRTKLLSVTAVTGISTVGIFTVGVTNTGGPVGVASTTYIRSVVLHNTGLGTARTSLYLYPNTTPVTGVAVTANRILRIDLASNETTFFETNYPIVMTNRDSLAIEVSAPDSGGTGVGTAINVLINGDTDI